MKPSLKRRCSTRRALALDVAVAHVDLRGLREARELLVRRLRRDDARRRFAEVLEPHREAPLVERMEFHEAGPGLVEQDVVAQMADALNDPLGVVDRAVIGALLDHRDAERPLALPGLGILDQRIGADALADRRFVERVGADRADQARRRCGRSGRKIGTPPPSSSAPWWAALWLLRSNSTRSSSATRLVSTTLFDVDVPLSTK